MDQVARVLDYIFCFPDRIEGPKTTFAFWRYRVNDIMAEDDFIPENPAERAIRLKDYPFPAALRTEKWQQWWLRYSAARKIYEITVKPEDRTALPFDRSTRMLVMRHAQSPCWQITSRSPRIPRTP